MFIYPQKLTAGVGREMCEVLVKEHGADVHRDNIGGETALHAAGASKYGTCKTVTARFWPLSDSQG